MITHLVYILSALTFGLTCLSPKPVDDKLKSLAPLPALLKECSGLVSLGNGFYAGTNDSGNPAELYVFTLDNQKDARVVKIEGVVNHDWEELTTDEEYIYIGDTGNNSGTRKDLAIYRVRKEELMQKDKLGAEVITFYYPEQEKFKSSDDHNFDCEAMVCAGDSIYLFTKNRGNSRTDLYRLPKQPGQYAAQYIDQFDAGGLITGASVRDSSGIYQLVLIGYMDKEHGYHPFLLYFSNVPQNSFFHSPVKRVSFESKLQTETVVFFDKGSVLITNEEEHGDQGMIYQVDLLE